MQYVRYSLGTYCGGSFSQLHCKEGSKSGVKLCSDVFCIVMLIVIAVCKGNHYCHACKYELQVAQADESHADMSCRWHKRMKVTQIYKSHRHAYSEGIGCTDKECEGAS
jgi:hypothetical protein